MCRLAQPARRSRVRPGGLCYITSPPRLKFLFGPDPHCGIPGLLLLPDALQSALFAFLRPHEHYEVEHVFWSMFGITRNFQELRVLEVVSRNWAGPLRRLDWDWIILGKT
jgi:hypothetical protein